MRHSAKPRYRAAWNVSIKCSHLNAGHDCCSHWLARLQQTGPLSLALHLFSRPSPRVSQKGRLTSFRGMLPSNLVINLPSSFPWIDAKPVFQRGHKVTAEMSLSRNSPEAFVSSGKITQGRRGKSKVTFPHLPSWRSRLSRHSKAPSPAASNDHFVPRARKQAYHLLLAAAFHRTVVLKHCEFGPFVMSRWRHLSKHVETTAKHQLCNRLLSGNMIVKAHFYNLAFPSTAWAVVVLYVTLCMWYDVHGYWWCLFIVKHFDVFDCAI